MKAFQWNGNPGLNGLAFQEIPTPTPGPGQVLLKMKAWSLNYRDLLVVEGKYGKGVPVPLTILSDGVGLVHEAGPGVPSGIFQKRVAVNFFPDWLDGPCQEMKTRISLGGTAQGLLSEYAICNADALVEIPEYLSDEEGACLPCAALTAWNTLFESANFHPGKSILTMGCGGVSLFALQFATMAKAKTFAISRNQANLDRLGHLGLNHGINTSANPDWGEAIRKLSQGGVDQSLELIGAQALPQTMKATRIGGEISLIGVLGGNTREFNPMPIIMKAQKLQGIFVGSKAMFQRMATALNVGKIKPVIHKVFPWQETGEALDALKRGEHFGKICLTAN